MPQLYWRWYSIIDYLRYSWGSLMANQARLARCAARRCRPPPSHARPAPAPPAACPLPAQFEGERNIPAFGGIPVLHYYSLDAVSKWAWLGWMALFFAAYVALAWAALATVRHQRR